MDALPFQPLLLHAINAARNVRRRWSVTAYRDLFGDIIVETSWGRIGAKGRSLVRSFGEEEEARRYVHALLARRGRSVGRIGVAYRHAPDRESSS